MDTIKKKIQQRDDEWEFEVSRRLSLSIDLVASDAVYHKQCKTYFLCDKQLPGTKRGLVTPGRPVQKDKEDAFFKLGNWLFTVTELHEKLCSITGLSDTYSVKWLKKRLQEQYKEHIFCTDHPGKTNTVCFKDMANEIINNKRYADQSANLTEERTRIITAAVQLIKNEIRNKTFDIEHYPTIKDLESGRAILPPTLELLMKSLVASQLKQASISLCILKAMRPNSAIPPLLFGPGVEVDYVIGS